MKKDKIKKISHTSKNKPETYMKVPSNIELMPFLINQLPHKNRNNIKTLLKEKQVWVNGKSVTQFNHRLVTGDMVSVNKVRLTGENKPEGIKIIYEDSDIIVIDKQAGVLTIATDKQRDHTAYSMLRNYVKLQDPANKIFIVHRLDRDTSGLLMFAKTAEIQKLLQESWHNIVTERTYLAIAEGMVEKDEDEIVSYVKENKAMVVYSSAKPDDGQKAVTRYKALKRKNNYSLLKLNLETGRKNQIRVHMQDIGHCIAGDKKYGAKTNPIGRLGLHAWALGFIHPVSKKELRFETKIPRKFSILF